MVNERYKKKLIEIIKKYLPDCKIYLYGSRARGDFSQGSDIDLCIDAGKKIDFRILGDMKEEIEESTIPLFVDVVDYHEISEEFKNNIMKDAILWQ